MVVYSIEVIVIFSSADLHLCSKVGQDVTVMWVCPVHCKVGQDSTLVCVSH